MSEREDEIIKPGKIVAVLGGTSEVGRQLARRVLANGANVLILDREVGDVVVDLARGSRGSSGKVNGILFKEVDYADPSTIERALKAARGHFAGSEVSGILNCSEVELPVEVGGFRIVRPDFDSLVPKNIVP